MFARVALLNLLEPLDLIRAFQAHPPDGAASPPFPAPAFVTQFDLLTTLDREVRRRIDALPFAARWQRLLRPVTCFVGTSVSEYALFPGETGPEELVRAIVSRFTPSHSFVIVKDIPTESTLVGEEALAYSRRLSAACQAAGFVLLDGQALAYVPIDFRSIDEYMARFSHSRRKNLRRKLRHGRSVEVEAIATGDDRFADDSFVSAIYAMYLSVYAQSDIHFDLLTEPFFRAVLRSASMNGTLFLYRAGGAPIGWNLCFSENGMLVDKYVGFDYPSAREHDLYTVSWFHNLEQAVERRCRFYIAGWTDAEIKRRLGARFTPTLHAVHVRNPLLRALLKMSRRWFEPDRRWYASHVANAHP